MKFITSSILALILLVNLSSCENDTNASEGYLHFKKNTVQEKYGVCDGDSACGEINIEYPIFSKNDKKVDDVLNAEITKDISTFYDAKTVEETAQKFISEFSDYTKEFPDAIGNIWEVKMKYYITTNTENLLALTFYMEGYTGGAHGFRTTTYTNYNPKTAEKLKLTDVVSDVEKLRLLAEQVFIKEYDLDPKKSFNTQGFWFIDDLFALNNNFEVSPKGITFYYNQYEIAPYSQGPIIVSIPMSKLKGILIE